MRALVSGDRLRQAGIDPLDEVPGLVDPDAEADVARRHPPRLAGPLVDDQGLGAGVVHRHDPPLVVEDGTAARAARQVEIVLDDAAVFRGGRFGFRAIGPQGADRPVLEGGQGDGGVQGRDLAGETHGGHGLTDAQLPGMLARQEGRRRREVGIDDENAYVGRLRRAVVGRVLQVLIQDMCVRPADGRARLDGKGPRAVVPQLGEEVDQSLHDMGIGPDGVGIVGAEPGADEEVRVEDLEADGVDRLVQSGLLDHVRPVQEAACPSRGSGRSLGPLGALLTWFALLSLLPLLPLRTLGTFPALLTPLALGTRRTRRSRLTPLPLRACRPLLSLAGGEQRHQGPYEEPAHAGYW